MASNELLFGPSESITFCISSPKLSNILSLFHSGFHPSLEFFSVDTLSLISSSVQYSLSVSLVLTLNPKAPAHMEVECSMNVQQLHHSARREFPNLQSSREHLVW